MRPTSLWGVVSAALINPHRVENKYVKKKKLIENNSKRELFSQVYIFRLAAIHDVKTETLNSMALFMLAIDNGLIIL